MTDKKVPKNIRSLLTENKIEDALMELESIIKNIKLLNE